MGSGSELEIERTRIITVKYFLLYVNGLYLTGFSAILIKSFSVSSSGRSSSKIIRSEAWRIDRPWHTEEMMTRSTRDLIDNFMRGRICCETLITIE